MKVKTLKLTEIKPYWRNPRQNDNAVAVVKDSIQQFGFSQPILLDSEGVIVAGHTRYRAAMELGMESVPTITLDLTPEKAKAFRIADNKAGEFSAWDNDKLVQELRELPELKGMEIFFKGDELERMMATVQNVTIQQVTQANVNQQQQNADSRMQTQSEDTQARYVKTTCPHCFKDYFLDREELMKERAEGDPPEGATVVQLGGPESTAAP